MPPLLLAYPWPGNVRELKSAAERVCSVSPDAMSAEAIRQALEAAHWHKGNAARRLGIGRTTL